jgi:hypothetical protein
MSKISNYKVSPLVKATYFFLQYRLQRPTIYAFLDSRHNKVRGRLDEVAKYPHTLFRAAYDTKSRPSDGHLKKNFQENSLEWRNRKKLEDTQS